MVLSSFKRRLRVPDTVAAGLENRIRPHLAAVAAGGLRRTVGNDAAAVRPSVESLQSKVERHLESFAESLCDLLQVAVDGDTVILSGTVESDDDRQLVVQIIREIPGAVSLRDRLQVAYPGRPSATAAEPQALWTSILGAWGQRP